MLHDLLGFAVVAGVLTILPGLDSALVLRAALTRGRALAAATGAGICAGALLWGAGAAAGVSALLTASETAYLVLRIVGAAYLIYLGIVMLRAARRGEVLDLAAGRDATTTAWRAFRRGLLTNLLNPKIGAFYVAVLPQFLPAGRSHLAFGLLLALIHDVESVLWFAVLILGAHAVRGWLARRSTQRAIDAATGAVLLGFAAKLAIQS